MPLALLSFWEKDPWLPLAQGLHRLGWSLIASEGTARWLAEHGIPARTITDLTQVPPLLEGRVKTLHPKVFAGILARDLPQDQADLERLQAPRIDLVAVSLYPFQEVIRQPEASLETVLEHIDIGGVALLRAAAKNFPHVTVLVDPQDAAPVLHELETQGETTLATRRGLAWKAFARSTAYDAAIAHYLSEGAFTALPLYRQRVLRYGENPHQQAELWSLQPEAGILGGRVLKEGKPLSFNNLVDLDAAWRAVQRLPKPGVVIVKHASPCGLATGSTVAEAFRKALASDPVSAFGSVIAVNTTLDEAAAQAMWTLFIEVLAAPDFTEGALEILQRRKNLRVLALPEAPPAEARWRSVLGGMLRQDDDPGDPEGTTWQVVTRREPTEAEWEDLRFAWLAVQPVLSNAVVLVKNRATVGIGGGQPNRVDAVRLAVMRAGERARGAVLASDAFFPFPDGVEEAAKAGVTAVIQPGGSIRDKEVIAAADRLGLAMVFTGVRHFRH